MLLECDEGVYLQARRFCIGRQAGVALLAVKEPVLPDGQPEAYYVGVLAMVLDVLTSATKDGPISMTSEQLAYYDRIGWECRLRLDPQLQDSDENEHAGVATT